MPTDRKRSLRGGAAGPLQSALFDLAKTHRLERSVDLAIRRGYVESIIDRNLDAGMVSVARTLARAIDEAASGGGDRWLLARLVGELRETLIRLRLDPVSRGSDKNEFGQLLAAMREPTVGDTTNA
jgi:hypothetical protein